MVPGGSATAPRRGPREDGDLLAVSHNVARLAKIHAAALAELHPSAVDGGALQQQQGNADTETHLAGDGWGWMAVVEGRFRWCNLGVEDRFSKLGK